MEAARSGHFECVRMLVERGARLDVKDVRFILYMVLAHTNRNQK